MDNSYNYIYTITACNHVNKINNIVKDEKLEMIYRNLLELLNKSKAENNLLFKIWIEHLELQLDNFINSVEQCDNFIKNYNNTSKKYTMNNKEIESLFILSKMKEKHFI